MKQINFVAYLDNNKWSFVNKDKLYQIILPNKVFQVHANKKAALSFMSKTSRLYNAKLFELNSIYIDVWSKYQQYWFVMSVQESREFDGAFSEISNQFYQMIKVSGIPDNGVYHVYAKINHCSDELKYIINRMVKLLKKLNYHQEAALISLFIIRLHNLIREINEWGFDENHDPSGRFNEDLSIRWIDQQ